MARGECYDEHMMIDSLLKKYKLTHAQAVRYLLVALVIGLVVYAMFSTLRGFGRGVVPGSTASFAQSGMMRAAPDMDGYGYGGGNMADDRMAYMEEAAYAPELSVRNVAGMVMPSPEPYPSATVGADGEDFEVTSYFARYEAHDSKRTCGTLVALKSRPEIVFERTDTYDRGCDMHFKVERAAAEEVLATLKALHPEDLSENVHTIQKQVEDFTSTETILSRKLAAIDETLEVSLAAYDDITGLATDTQNADALVRIIDGRIGVIERLTQERLATVAQLERLSRQKAEAMDRLVYTHFDVSVQENKFVDLRWIKDSWKEALQSFVFEFNLALQGVTLGLIVWVLILAQYLLYAVVILVVVKYGWYHVRKFWKS